MTPAEPTLTMHARTGGSTHGHPRIHLATSATTTVCGLPLDRDRWTTRSKLSPQDKVCGDCRRRVTEGR